MNFILINGETHTITLNVKDLIKTSHDGTQSVHKIQAEITLPEAIGNGDGVFNPDIEEWADHCCGVIFQSQQHRNIPRQAAQTGACRQLAFICVKSIF